jgi:dTDP-4-dehydrorhamnose reductase
LDFTDTASVDRLVNRLKPDVIYLPAALTNVDYCELHPESSYAVNVLGPHNVVHKASFLGTKIVFFSSDYVFDGVKGPYSEDAPVNPICTYGLHKVIAEHCVALQGQRHLIVRTTVVFGWERLGKNFVQRLIANLSRGESVPAPVDQIGSPTYAPDLAKAVVQLVEAGGEGLYHVVGSASASRYHLALAAAEAFGLDTSLIRPVTTDQLSPVAPRPLRAGMQTVRLQTTLGTGLEGYPDAIRRMATEDREYQQR